MNGAVVIQAFVGETGEKLGANIEYKMKFESKKIPYEKRKNEEKRAVGIDLGTSNCLAAYWENGKVNWIYREGEFRNKCIRSY